MGSVCVTSALLFSPRPKKESDKCFASRLAVQERSMRSFERLYGIFYRRKRQARYYTATILGPVLLKTGDDISTDDMMPADAQKLP